METTEDRRQTPRSRLKDRRSGKNSPEDESRLGGQLADITERSRGTAQRVDQDYETGRICVQIEDEGLWVTSARPRQTSPLAFISQETGVARSTLDPWYRMARNLDKEHVMELARKGLSTSAIAEVARAEPPLRDKQVALALQPEVTLGILKKVRRAGNAVYHKNAAKKKKEAKTSPETLQNEALAQMHESLKTSFEDKAAECRKQDEEEAAAQECPRCSGAVDGGGSEQRREGGGFVNAPQQQGPAAFLYKDGEELYKKGLAAQAQADHDQKEASELLVQARTRSEAAEEASAKAAEATAQAKLTADQAQKDLAALAAREAALAEERRQFESGTGLAAEAAAAGLPLGAYIQSKLDQLSVERRRLEQDQAAAAAAMAQAERSRDEAAKHEQATAEHERVAAQKAQAVSEQEQRTTADQAAAAAALLEAEQLLSGAREKAEALAQDRAGVDRQKKAGEERDAALALRELEMAEQEQGLKVRDEALRSMEGQVAEQSADLVRREKELAERSFRVHKVALREMKVDWHEHPNSLDEVLEFMRALALKLRLLAQRDAPKYLARDEGLQYSELELVREANRTAIFANEAIDQFMGTFANYYQENYPDEWREFCERVEVARLSESDGDGGDGGDGGGGGGGAPSGGGTGGGGGGVGGGGAASGGGGSTGGGARAAASAAVAGPGGATVHGVSVAGPVHVPAMPTGIGAMPTYSCVGGNVTLLGAGPADAPKVPIEVVLGSEPGEKKQWGLFALGQQGGGIFIDIDQAQVISIYGLQKYGKTSSILNLVEMMMSSKRRISHVPAPLGGVWAHFGKGTSYPPGIVKARNPNAERDSIRFLTDKLGALPESIKAKMEVLVPPMLPEQLAERRAQFPGLPVECLEMTVEDFGIIGIRQFMLATDNSAMYMSTLDLTLRGLSPRASLEEVEAALAAADFTPQGRKLMQGRWSVLRPYLMGQQSIRHRLKPGVLLVLDIRNEWITEREAMALFTVLMNSFSESRDDDGKKFLKFMVFDEAYKYMAKGTVSTDIVEMIKEMRHRFMTVIIATQDPESVEFEVHKLSTITIVHKTRSSKSLNVLRQGNAAWDVVTIEQLAALPNGEAFIATASASVEVWEREARHARVRPTCAHPIGTSRTATGVAGGD